MAKVDYKAILDEAWQQHLAPKQLNAPTVISTFAGCGGSSLGYSMAGYRELLAVEWNDNAVATFKLNFPDIPVYHGDICKLTVKRCLEITGLEPGQLDLLDGSPPCQGFSTAGKRILEDERNQLFREFVRLLRGLQPKVFVMENVSGLVKGKMKLIFAEIMRELKASGYKVKCRLMNAMYFQVPQSRERLFWIGLRDELGNMPNFPKAQHRPINAYEIIGDAIYSDGFSSGTRESNRPIPTMRKSRIPSIQSRSMAINKWADGPARTLVKTCSDWQVRINGKPRRPTIEEAKSFGSYPIQFQMAGSLANQWARIGNSVPPLFMRALARHIRQQVFSESLRVSK
jgi:DNA (cytosine-5)-methyltransferase 1